MGSYVMDHKYGRCTRQREQLAGNLNVANLWVLLDMRYLQPTHIQRALVKKVLNLRVQ